MSEFEGRGIGGHLCSFIGETVTLFTESGGNSGRGFTGVVISVNDCFVRLVTRFGSPPSCALGSDCDCCFRSGRNFRNNSERCNFGSVADIPVDKIVAFVHNAV